MTPLFKKDLEKDSIDTLERKMIRTLALHREIQKLLEAEYEAGNNFDTRTLEKLTLRKNNCINRLEHLVGAIRDQMKRMVTEKLPNTCPRTLANRLKAIPGITPEREANLLPLAREIEAENRIMIEATRRNMAMFKKTMDRIWAVSKYAKQGAKV